MDEPEKRRNIHTNFGNNRGKIFRIGKNWSQQWRANIFLESWTKVERERERDKERIWKQEEMESRSIFFGISNGEKWKEKKDSFVNKSGILVMEDKSQNREFYDSSLYG